MKRRSRDALGVLAELTAAMGVLGLAALATAARRPKVPRAEEQPTMKAPQVADILGLSVSTVTRLCRTGDIPSFRAGRFILVPTASLRRMLGLDVVEEDPDAAA